MERIAYAALALPVLEYIALGGWLGHAWGVNPSRATPYARRTGKRRGGWLALLGGYTLVLAVLQAVIYAPLMHAEGQFSAPVPLLTAALLGGVISMLTLFAAIRHEGQSMPQIVTECYGTWAGRGMYALCALSMGLAASALLALGSVLLRGGLRIGAMPEQIAAYALLMLLGLCAAYPSCVCAPRLRSERHIRRVGLGGVLLGFVVLALGLLPAVRGALAQRLTETMERCIAAALCGCSALFAAYMACVSAKGLFARRVLLMRKKPKAESLAPLAMLVLIALLTRAGFGYLMLFAGVLGFAYALLTLIVCVLWLGSVGRGLFFSTK